MNFEDETPAEALESLIQSLRSLLDVVDSHGEDDKSLMASWKQCQTMLIAFRAKSASVVSQSEEERAALQEQLQTAVRLNAIATHLVQRETERVSAELNLLRDTKKKLRSQIARSNESGGSVDLAG